MSLVVASLAAAAAAGVTAGAFAWRRWLRRRRAAAASSRPLALLAPATEEGAAATDPLAELRLGLGEVVQVAGESRWPRSAVAVMQDGAVRCALLLSREHGSEQLVVAFREPERHIYWLERTTTELPSSPPTRLELGRGLLDRRASFPGELETLGEPMLDVSGGGTISLYEGAIGDAALVLSSGPTAHVWHGLRVEDGDYELLGTVTPSDEIGAS
jgi:hypothetical protein